MPRSGLGYKRGSEDARDIPSLIISVAVFVTVAALDDMVKVLVGLGLRMPGGGTASGTP
jgi:hypothetical protein